MTANLELKVEADGEDDEADKVEQHREERQIERQSVVQVLPGRVR